MAELVLGAERQVILDGADETDLKRVHAASQAVNWPFDMLVKRVDFARQVASDPEPLSSDMWETAVSMMVRVSSDIKLFLEDEMPSGLSLARIAPALPNPGWKPPRRGNTGSIQHSGSRQYTGQSRYDFFSEKGLVDLVKSRSGGLERYPNGLVDLAVVARVRPQSQATFQPREGYVSLASLSRF